MPFTFPVAHGEDVPSFLFIIHPIISRMPIKFRLHEVHCPKHPKRCVLIFSLNRKRARPINRFFSGFNTLSVTHL